MNVLLSSLVIIPQHQYKSSVAGIQELWCVQEHSHLFSALCFYLAKNYWYLVLQIDNHHTIRPTYCNHVIQCD